MENIIRTIGYVALFIMNAVLFYFLHSHFHFIVLILMAAAPVLSVLSALLLRHTVAVTVESRGEGYGRQNEEAYFTVYIHNPSWVVSLDAKLKLVVRNTFFGTEGTSIISVPVYAGKGYTLELPIIASYSGIVQIEVESIRVKDLMGFCYLKKAVSARGELIVLPEDIGEADYETLNLEQGMLESDESTKRGSDFSDVQEIREYIPGDRLMSIHWKLSAKRDILMVKDRVSMSDKQLVILPELCNADNMLLDMVLSTTYSVIKRLLEDKTTVRLMYWSAAGYEYKDIRIDYPEEASEAFAGMFYESTYAGMDEAASHMASVHPELGAYLHVAGKPGGVMIRLRENG